MSVIVHENLGLIDPRAFTTRGLNAKPNTKSPIGYFGTGLKKALKLLLEKTYTNHDREVDEAILREAEQPLKSQEEPMVSSVDDIPF